MNPTPTTASWEERLMDKFCVMFSRAEMGEGDPYDWPELLEAFIRSLLKENTTATLREVMEEVGTLKGPLYTFAGLPEHIIAQANKSTVLHNETIDKVVKLLQNKLTSEL